jgi:hypothetical protein
MYKSVYTKSRYKYKYEEVEFIKFSDLIKSINSNILLMDIEGAEIDILLNNYKLCKYFDMIVFEYHSKNRIEINDLVNIYKKYKKDYKYFYLSHKPIYSTKDGHIYFYQGSVIVYMSNRKHNKMTDINLENVVNLYNDIYYKFNQSLNT